MQARTGRSTTRRAAPRAPGRLSSRCLTAGALVLSAGALTAGLGAVSRAATPTTPKPQVLILLDTSGSMEYEAGSSGGGGTDFTVPACEAFTATTPVTGATYAKSRLTVAKEVLTGTYVDYWCRTDERTASTGHAGLADLDYPIPHTIPCSDASTSPTCAAPSQKADGLLDLRKGDFLFGLMTFDAIEDPGTGEAGGYSFGGATATGIDLGIKNSRWGVPDISDTWDSANKTWIDVVRSKENNGQLIPPWTPTNGVSMDGWNQLIQREIQDLVGYWGTPISPMLMDVSDFLESDPRVGIPPSGPNPTVGDPYAECRQRVAILITDGRASQGEGAGGYPSTIKALQRLQGSPSWVSPEYATRVFVIGYFGAGSASGNDPLQIYRDFLGADHVYQANTSADLALSMSNIFAKVLTGRHSRTPVVITNATQANSRFALQLRFSAGYRGDGDETGDEGGNDRNLIGYLDARVIGCDDSDGIAAAHELALFQPDLDALGEQDENTRKIRFVVGKKLEEVVKPDGKIKLNKLNDGPLGYADFLDIASRADQATDIYQTMSGGASAELQVDMGPCNAQCSTTPSQTCCASASGPGQEIQCTTPTDCLVPLSTAAAVWSNVAAPGTATVPCSMAVACTGTLCADSTGTSCNSGLDCYWRSTAPPDNCDWTATPTATGSAFLGSFTTSSVRKKYAKRLLSFLTSKPDSGTGGDNPRARPNTAGKYIRRLGAISRSTPAIQEPAQLGRYPLESWNSYVEGKQPCKYKGGKCSAGCRPTVLYAGSNDGLLHAFRVDLQGPDSCGGASDPQWTGGTFDLASSTLRKNFGRELWAVMPSGLLKFATALDHGPPYLLDGPLVVQDVLLRRSAPTGSTGSNAGEWKNWRSVLVASYGEGGRGFLALDVTTPGAIDDVKLLWEISSDRVCNSTGCHDFTESGWDFSNVGMTTGAPAFGTAFLGGDEVAVAILPGGKRPAGAPADWTPTVYVVRVDTGEILRAFHSPDGVPFTGSASAYPSTPGVVTTRAFLGDEGGRLWRVKMVGQPSAWSLDGPYDDFYGASGAGWQRQAILGTAKVAPVGFGRIEVVIGLGQEGNEPNGVSRGAVLSYEDAGTESPLLLRWLQPLDEGEYLTGEPVVFGKKVHFSTAVEPAGSLCSGRTGRIWSLHYANHSGSDPVGAASTVDLSGGNHPCTVPAAANDRYCQMDTVAYGVQMVQLPSCVSSSVSPTAADSAAAQGGMKLVANIADTTSSPGVGLPPSPSTTPGTPRTEVKASSTNEYNETLQSAAWGYVLY